MPDMTSSGPKTDPIDVLSDIVFDAMSGVKKLASIPALIITSTASAYDNYNPSIITE